MAGTKYTRKPKKKVAKKDQSITQRGVKKKSILKTALKNTAKGLVKGAISVGSMSPVGRGVKAAKVAKKAVKVLKKVKKKSTPYTPKQAKSARKYVKELDARIKKDGLEKLSKRGYSLKDLEY